MSERVKFLMTFRARLMLLLTSFLLITIVLVVVLDNWARQRAAAEVERQTQQVRQSVSEGFRGLAEAIGLATLSLDRDDYLYDQIGHNSLPPTVEVIIVAEKDGKIRDSSRRELISEHVYVPKDENIHVLSIDPVEKEDETHEHAPQTYYQPVTTTKGLFWIVIVTTQQTVIGKIEDASKTLANKNRDLSNYRLLATAGLLMLALGIAVIIGWRFTQPIKELAGAARRVADGDLNFQVGIERRDEVGQLASTFNEMIQGLQSKRELEEKLNQAERSAVIGRLTQAVAHEIRNPLNVINLSIDHASQKFAPADEARRKQFTRLLSSVKDEIARLKHLVSDLLNYGRPAHLAVQSIDMRQLVDDTLALLRPQADEQGVAIAVENDEQPAEVRGDPERLKSCLSNIAINALQAMPGGGRLETRVHRENGLIEISIRDTGAGISEENLSKIFEPYFSTKQAGFGLGLAVTKKIIVEHNGSIEVESRPDEGTTFTMKFPAVGDGRDSAPSG